MTRITPGAPVLVVDGPLRGRLGTVEDRAFGGLTFGGETVWRVRFPGVAHTSSLRGSYLAPAPPESDDDVLSPLRRTTCP